MATPSGTTRVRWHCCSDAPPASRQRSGTRGHRRAASSSSRRRRSPRASSTRRSRADDRLYRSASQEVFDRDRLYVRRTEARASRATASSFILLPSMSSAHSRGTAQRCGTCRAISTTTGRSRTRCVADEQRSEPKACGPRAFARCSVHDRGQKMSPRRSRSCGTPASRASSSSRSPSSTLLACHQGARAAAPLTW